MLLFLWTSLVGVVRAEFLRVRHFRYTSRAARTSAQAPGDVQHILPNASRCGLTFLRPALASGGHPDHFLGLKPALAL